MAWHLHLLIFINFLPLPHTTPHLQPLPRATDCLPLQWEQYVIHLCTPNPYYRAWHTVGVQNMFAY